SPVFLYAQAKPQARTVDCSFPEGKQFFLPPQAAKDRNPAEGGLMLSFAVRRSSFAASCSVSIDHCSLLIVVRRSSSFTTFSTSWMHSSSPALSRTTCPVLVVAPTRKALLRRSSNGSISSACASSSMFDSTANADWVTPNPRNAPAGGLLVYMA